MDSLTVSAPVAEGKSSESIPTRFVLFSTGVRGAPQKGPILPGLGRIESGAGSWLGR